MGSICCRLDFPFKHDAGTDAVLLVVYAGDGVFGDVTPDAVTVSRVVAVPFVIVIFFILVVDNVFDQTGVPLVAGFLINAPSVVVLVSETEIEVVVKRIAFVDGSVLLFGIGIYYEVPVLSAVVFGSADFHVVGQTVIGYAAQVVEMLAHVNQRHLVQFDF